MVLKTGQSFAGGKLIKVVFPQTNIILKRQRVRVVSGSVLLRKYGCQMSFRNNWEPEGVFVCLWPLNPFVMNVQQSYNLWSAQYDTNKNRTRDLEARVLRSTLQNIPVNNCLEIGCGTGKNTEWLVSQAARVTAVDLSEGMLDVARGKIASARVEFRQADITQDWDFGAGDYDLVTFSLVLEHIEHLEPVFREAAQALVPGGYVYVGELHPFKQYTGTKARFDTEQGRQEVPCFNHHISDFLQAAEVNGLELVQLEEHFDDDDRTTIPRVVTFLMRKR